MTAIIAMNRSEYKYYVYSEHGLLLNRINFSGFVEKYGRPM